MLSVIYVFFFLDESQQNFSVMFVAVCLNKVLFTQTNPVYFFCILHLSITKVRI